ncbi:MAG: hypothetical protein ACJ786_41035 [Catenulispora sp.]
MPAISLQRFLTLLNANLDRLGTDGIREAVIRQGSALSASQRTAFLAAFAPPTPDPAAGAGAEDKALIGDIEDFRARVEAGEFRGEYSWDDHGYGDDSWVGEIDALFGAADTAFLSGHLTTAADAYRALFAILDLDDAAQVSTTTHGPRSGTPATAPSTGNWPPPENHPRSQATPVKPKPPSRGAGRRAKR